VGFRRQEEEARLVEDLMARDHSSHGVLLRLSETYAHQHGVITSYTLLSRPRTIRVSH
jgi:hypothetical protein